MPIITPKIASNARGGTELMCERIQKAIEPELLEAVNIYPSRVDQYTSDKPSIYYVHDLADDPLTQHLENGGWSKFNRIVFVSHWQRDQYIAKYKIPHSKCIVLHNAIEHMGNIHLNSYERDRDKIVVGYWSTPHRGLQLLDMVWKHLTKQAYVFGITLPIELRVFSSFDLYGWEERDAQYKSTFESLQSQPNVKYSKSVSNEQLRKELLDIDILAYPCIWEETSCLVLIEAMMAGIVAVHSDLAALPETAGGWTAMYGYTEDPQKHMERFGGALSSAIVQVQQEKKVLAPQAASVLRNGAKTLALKRHNWAWKAEEWKNLITEVMYEQPAQMKVPMFTFQT